MARHPTPDALRDVRGNPGRRPRRTAPDLPEAAIGDAPAHLSPEARAVWQHNAPRLQEMKFLRSTDYPAMARWCEWCVLWMKLKRRVTVTKLVQHTVSDFVEMDRLSKHFLALLHIEKRLVDLEDRIGMNPRARQQMMVQAAGLNVAPSLELMRDDAPPAPSPVGMLNVGHA